MRNRKTRLLLAAAFIVCAVTDSLAADVKLIANSSVTVGVLSPVDLKAVFLEEKNSIEGSHVEPVLEKDGPVHEAFLQEYLGRSADDPQAYYRALVFTGRGSMPKVLGSDADVVAYIARTRGAIGYVNSATAAEGVKTLAVGIVDNKAERRLLTRIEPEYPDTLKDLRIGGIVRLRLSISAKGNVEQVELLGGNPILGESAASAARKWVYAAGRSRTIAEVSLRFGDN
jgi:TonB family protein